MSVNHRVARHEFSAGTLPPDTFRVVRFEGEEAMSALYRVEIDLVSNDPAIAFEDVVGQPALLTMLRGDDASPLYGLVVGFEQAGMLHGETDYPYLYRAVLVPHLSVLALTTQSRIFQNLTVEEIVTDVLADHGIVADLDFRGVYEPREYCTQYQESDLAFVQRLLEYEGAYYYFDHVHDVQKGAAGGAVETLVVRDTAVADAVAIEGAPGVRYRQGAGLMSADGDEFIGAFVVRQQLVTAQAEVVTYNYRTAETKILEASAAHPEQAAGSASEFAGGQILTPARARALAGVRSEEIEASRLVMTGDSDVQRFRAGFTFDLKDHYRTDLDQAYRITSVRHTGGQASAAGGDEGGATLGYRNAFACVPASVAWRPARLTPEPRLPGILTARVETTGGDYAPVDEFGRYHIRFPFDQSSTPQAGATKAVRMAQPYTGPGYGHHFPVHAGTEMVVACVNGNVDRIVGLSTIWNSTEKSPVTSDNASQSVLRSWGKNELRFDDKKGQEDVYLHATKDHTVRVVNDENVAVGTNRTQQVGHDEALKVGHDQSEKVGHDHRLEIGNDQSIAVGLNRSMDVGTDLTESVGASMSLTVGASSTETVAVAKTVTIGAALVLTVGAAKSETVGGLSNETVGGFKSVEAGLDISHRAGSAYSVTAGKDVGVTAGKNISLKAGEGGTLQVSKNLTISVGKKAVIEVQDQLTLKCGSAEIVLKKNGDISIKGGKIDLKGSGKMTLKGSQIAGN